MRIPKRMIHFLHTRNEEIVYVLCVTINWSSIEGGRSVFQQVHFSAASRECVDPD
jgi:hypothetical protein